MPPTSTIAIQGIEGSFHAMAAAKLIPGATAHACDTFQEVFTAVHDGHTDFGIVAIENSLHGPINIVYRLLDQYHQSGLRIIGETTLHIDQYLIGVESVTKNLEALNTPETTVFSQAPALAQCEAWLTAHLPHAARQETGDTAGSVKQVVENKNPHHLAVAGSQTATLYGGSIVAGPINDDPHNYTRFVLLQKERAEVPNTSDRTLIILVTDNTEGSLYRALGAFADAHISLSKLDSHPIPGDQRHYAFYIDIEAGIRDPALTQAFTQLTTQGCTVKVLGSYAVIV